MSILWIWIGMHIRCWVLVCTQAGGRSTQQKTEEEWIVKDVRQLGCVLQDTEPPESSSILQKSTKVLGSIRRVRFTTATQRHANIPENKGPSLGKVQVKVPHQRSPYALKFEDRSQEEIERQERWRVEIGQERNGQSYLLLTYQRMVSSSAIRNKTGGKRVCCRLRREHAHVEQERPELCRIGNRKSLTNPTTVVTANGEVRTKRRSDSVCQRIGFIRER